MDLIAILTFIFAKLSFLNSFDILDIEGKELLSFLNLNLGGLFRGLFYGGGDIRKYILILLININIILSESITFSTTIPLVLLMSALLL